ncbi:MAG: rhodanese-like domain-containing protein [Bacteroidota bacterium]
MKNSKIKKPGYIALAVLSIFSSMVKAQVTPSLVDFDAYEKLVAEVKEHRKSRMLNAEEFVKTSKEEKVIILDTRSDSMYKAVHVKGAVHLNFSDFTQDNLAKIIPSNDYKILIYCNNNFISKPMQVSLAIRPDFSPYFVTKMTRPFDSKAIFIPPTTTKKAKKKQTKAPKQTLSNQFVTPSVTDKPITLALNIPTYINLYGYGYKNVYELSELVNTNSNKLEFEGTAVIPEVKNN